MITMMVGTRWFEDYYEYWDLVHDFCLGNQHKWTSMTWWYSQSAAGCFSSDNQSQQLAVSFVMRTATCTAHRPDAPKDILSRAKENVLAQCYHTTKREARAGRALPWTSKRKCQHWHEISATILSHINITIGSAVTEKKKKKKKKG